MVLYAHLVMTTSMLGRSFARWVWVGVSLLTTQSLMAATRTVDLGTVEVESAAPAAYQEAMRTVLIRLTGRRSAASDPSLRPLLENAERYVQIFRPATADLRAAVTLDDLAVERALDDLGEPIWPRERPIVLGVILSAPPGADAGQVRTRLTETAAERGLPLELSAAASAGLRPGASADAGEALAAARRMGASAALIGEAFGDRWRWTLFQATAGASPIRTEGEVIAGVERAADALALGSQAVALQPVSEVELTVLDVADLATHGAVRRALAEMVVIKNIDLLAVGPRELSFRIQVSGGLRGLTAALDADPAWSRETAAGGLRYRFLGAVQAAR